MRLDKRRREFNYFKTTSATSVGPGLILGGVSEAGWGSELEDVIAPPLAAITGGCACADYIQRTIEH